MLKALVYDANAARRGRICAAVNSILADVGCTTFGLIRVGTLDDLSATVGLIRPGVLHLIVCHVEACAAKAKEVLDLVRVENPDATLAIIADDPSCARYAYAIGANGFCLFNEGKEGLARAIALPVRRVVEARRCNTVGLRTDAGVGNAIVDDITFVEASRKGSLVHLAGAEPLLVRTTLRALYDKLVAKGHFAAAGSSFLVNLDNVRSVGEGTVLFADGESIIVPIRVRKSIKNAFEDSWRRVSLLYTDEDFAGEAGRASGDAAADDAGAAERVASLPGGAPEAGAAGGASASAVAAGSSSSPKTADERYTW